MAGYLRELARVVAAARGAAGAGANASAKAVFGAVTAARKGVERRDLEVRLLYSFLVTIATYQGAAALLTTPTTPGAAALLVLSTYYSSYYSRCGCSTYYSS